jgi:II/X family phage/plasmid replication protein
MIDLLVLKIRTPHKPFGSVRYIEREDGTDGVTKCLTKNVRLYSDGAVIRVTSLNHGTQIGIRCCPAKALQGHNIFGTNNVIGLAHKLIEYVLAALGVEASQEQFEAWEGGEFEILALDITHRFGADSHPLVSRVLTHLFRTTSLQLRPTPIYPGIGVRMMAPHRQASWLFYDKRLEFDDKRHKEGAYLLPFIGVDKPGAKTIVDLLRQSASENIRAELKLGKTYLKEHKQNVGSAWSRKRVMDTYFQELGLLRLGAVPSVEHAKVLLDRLIHPKLRQTFIGWLQGEDLSTYGNRQTLRGRRRAILEAAGIDIWQDVVPLKTSPLHLADIFDVDNLLPDFPDWADQYPAVCYKGHPIPSQSDVIS